MLQKTEMLLTFFAARALSCAMFNLMSAGTFRVSSAELSPTSVCIVARGSSLHNRWRDLHLSLNFIRLLWAHSSSRLRLFWVAATPSSILAVPLSLKPSANLTGVYSIQFVAWIRWFSRCCVKEWNRERACPAFSFLLFSCHKHLYYLIIIHSWQYSVGIYKWSPHLTLLFCLSETYHGQQEVWNHFEKIRKWSRYSTWLLCIY